MPTGSTFASTTAYVAMTRTWIMISSCLMQSLCHSHVWSLDRLIAFALQLHGLHLPVRVQRSLVRIQGQ